MANISDLPPVPRSDGLGDTPPSYSDSQKKVGSAGGTFIDTINGLMDKAGDISWLLDQVQFYIGAINDFSDIGNQLQEALNDMMSKSPVNTPEEDAQTIVDCLNKLSSFADNLKDQLTAKFQAKYGDPLPDWAQADIDSWVGNVQGWVDGVVDTFNQAISDATADMPDSGKENMSWIIQAANYFKQAAEGNSVDASQLAYVLKYVRALMPGIDGNEDTTFTSDIWSNIMNGVTNNTSTLPEATNSVFSQSATKLEGYINTLDQAATKLADTYKETVLFLLKSTAQISTS